uniref:Uncharacterized protein n=1 Tax=Tanacetum cinerariifolium TaxID=118510 RepID=A0A6L2LGE3_TANCI|nr:hypothetical protein [Tanacetum cinerariifolium]
MDTKVPQPSGPSVTGTDHAIHTVRGDSLVRAATTAASLDAEQDSGMSKHNAIYVIPSHTKKVFANMKRENKGFSRIPLFPTMMVETQEEIAKNKTVNGEEQLQALVDKKKVIITETTIIKALKLKDEGGVDCFSNEVIFEQLSLMGVLSLEQIKTNQATKIKKLKKRVKKLEVKKKKRIHGPKRLYKAGLSAMIVSSNEEDLGDQDDASKHKRIAKIDADEDLSLIDETVQDQGRIND